MPSTNPNAVHRIAKRSTIARTLMTTFALMSTAMAATPFVPMTLDSYFEEIHPVTESGSTYFSANLPTIRNKSDGEPTYQWFQGNLNTPLTESSGTFVTAHGSVTKMMGSIRYSPQISTGTTTDIFALIITDSIGQVAVKTFAYQPYFHTDNIIIAESNQTTRIELPHTQLTDRFNFKPQAVIPSDPTLNSDSTAPLRQPTFIEPIAAGGSGGLADVRLMTPKRNGADVQNIYNTWALKNSGTVHWGGGGNPTWFSVDFNSRDSSGVTNADQPDFFSFITVDNDGQMAAKSYYYIPQQSLCYQLKQYPMNHVYTLPPAANSASDTSSGQASNNVTISSLIALKENAIIDLNSSNMTSLRTLTINAPVKHGADESYGLTFIGRGAVAFTGAGKSESNYTGPTLHAREITVTDTPTRSAICPQITVRNGATYTDDGIVSGIGSLVVDTATPNDKTTPGGTLALTNAGNIYTGQTVIRNATLSVNQSSAISGGRIVMNGCPTMDNAPNVAQLQCQAILKAEGDLSRLDQPIHMLTEGVIDTNDHIVGTTTGPDATFGSGGLTITGGGTFRLNGQANHTGPTYIRNSTTVELHGAVSSQDLTDASFKKTDYILLESGKLSATGYVDSDRGFYLNCARPR